MPSKLPQTRLATMCARAGPQPEPFCSACATILLWGGLGGGQGLMREGCGKFNCHLFRG